MGKHLADHMRKLYDFSNGDPEIILTDDNPINEYCLSNKNNWEVTRLALDRAIKRIGAHTARGLDGIPARLLKCLEDADRQKLEDIFSGIMAGEPIPEDWQCGRVILVPKRGGDAGLLRVIGGTSGSLLSGTIEFQHLGAIDASPICSDWIASWENDPEHVT
ncbi:hypothetical protein MRX96_027837 [Rhipicephalus microplus]